MLPLGSIIGKTGTRIWRNGITFDAAALHNCNYRNALSIQGPDRLFATASYRERRPKENDAFYDSDGGGSNVIKIPLRLENRLGKKVIKDNMKHMIRKEFIQNSRRGSTKVVICARNPELNHYFGQSYSRKDELPLVSQGWAHRKAAAAQDFFKINAYGENPAVSDGDETFEDLGLNASVTKVLEKSHITKPTLIQKYGIPKLLKGTSCILSAETGCGKTLTYLLPLFQRILEFKRARIHQETMNNPYAVILVPSKELGVQVANVASYYGKELGINVKLLQSGAIGAKIASPPSIPIDLMISTVSVLLSLTKYEVYSMDRVKSLILDEADTLTDDSFSRGVSTFITRFPINVNDHRRVQIAFVSATMPKLHNSCLNDVLEMENLVEVKTPGLHQLMKHVPQTFLRVKKTQKPIKILELLNGDLAAGKGSSLVFCNTHDTCTWLTNHLNENGIQARLLSSGIQNSLRKENLYSFLFGDTKILVSTDIGSRGIDTIQTSHVINYDFPNFMADYIHRAGRTGRVGSSVTGSVTSLISWGSEVALVQSIERSVRQETSLRQVDANIKRHLNQKYGYGMNNEILPSEKNSKDGENEDRRPQNFS